MITCWWGTRVCSFVLCTIFSTSSLFSRSETETVTTRPMLDIKRVVDFGQHALDAINELDYFSAKDAVITIPTLNQELVINWGFAGSGDLFTALPMAKSLLRSTKIAQHGNEPFNIADLGALLAQDAITNKTKNLEMLSWLIDAEFGAFKVLCFKLFLLANDYRQDKIDAQTINNELLRLLVRLSLSSSDNVEDASKPLSQRLPRFIKELIQPEVLSLLDTTWSMINVSASENDTTM